MLTLAVIIVVTKLRCRARASAQDRGEVAAAARGDESEDEDLRDRSATLAREGRRSSVEVKLMSVMRHEEEDLADDVLKQQAKTRIQEHGEDIRFSVSLGAPPASLTPFRPFPVRRFTSPS